MFSFTSYNNLAAIKDPSYPAFLAIVLRGILIAYWIILIPATSPSDKSFLFFKASSVLEAYNKAAPPPTTIPSEIAALVAHKASVTLSLIYPT
jgi:hypothetical protein